MGYEYNRKIDPTISYFKCECGNNITIEDYSVIHIYSDCNKCKREVENINHTNIYEKHRDSQLSGFFYCECGNDWQSAYTWLDYFQQCILCNSEIYPHKFIIREDPKTRKE